MRITLRYLYYDQILFQLKTSFSLKSQLDEVLLAKRDNLNKRIMTTSDKKSEFKKKKKKAVCSDTNGKNI